MSVESDRWRDDGDEDEKNGVSKVEEEGEQGLEGNRQLMLPRPDHVFQPMIFMEPRNGNKSIRKLKSLHRLPFFVRRTCKEIQTSSLFCQIHNLINYEVNIGCFSQQIIGSPMLRKREQNWVLLRAEVGAERGVF